LKKVKHISIAILLGFQTWGMDLTLCCCSFFQEILANQTCHDVEKCCTKTTSKKCCQKKANLKLQESGIQAIALAQATVKPFYKIFKNSFSVSQIRPKDFFNIEEAPPKLSQNTCFLRLMRFQI